MTNKRLMKNILCIFLLASGLASLLMTFLIARSRENAVAVDSTLTIIAGAAMVTYSLIYTISALVSLTRRNIRKAARVRPFVQIAVVIALVQIIISTINGIYISHLIIVLIAGVFIPEMFFLLLTVVTN